MTDYQSSIAMVFDQARKVQEVGRDKELSRLFSGTEAEISSYEENVRTAVSGLNDAVTVIGELLMGCSDIDSATAERVGALLVGVGELQQVLSIEQFALSEKARL